MLPELQSVSMELQSAKPQRVEEGTEGEGLGQEANIILSNEIRKANER